MTTALTAPTLRRHAVIPCDSARPVRVCFMIDELGIAGTETQLLALIHHLDRRRVQPFLCLLRGESPLGPDDCPVLRLGVKSLRSPRTLLAAWKLRRFLRREQIDVLQVYFPDSTYLGVPVARLARVPAVVRTRNNIGHWLTPLHRFLGRLLNPLTTATIANCEAARDALLAAENTRPESVIVLENGVDLERFDEVPPLTPRPVRGSGIAMEGVARPESSKGVSSEPSRPSKTQGVPPASGPLRRVGVVANLRRVKGLDVFVEAAARVVRDVPDATFAVAGEGPEREALARQAAGLGLGERFVLRGGVQDVPGFLAGIDVAVLPSRAEGMSNAVLEYMAAGRAVIATAVGANPRLIDDGVHGLLVPPEDPASLAKAIRDLLDDPGRACRLARAARRRVEAEFSRAAMVRRFQAFYEGLVQR